MMLLFEPVVYLYNLLPVWTRLVVPPGGFHHHNSDVLVRRATE